MRLAQKKSKVFRWLRFLLGGGINTAFTYGVYLALIQVIGYQLAYFIAYSIGIVFAYWFNAIMVFRVPLSWKGFFSFPLVYVFQYVVSALLLNGLIEIGVTSETLAPLFVTAGMVPLTYVLSRRVLRNFLHVGKGKMNGPQKISIK
jgi:putative flippase GtrA